MLTEIITSLLITYASSEYLHGSKNRALRAVLGAFAAYIVHALPSVVAFLPALRFTTMLPIVALIYLVALYCDAVLCLGMPRLEFVIALNAAAVRLIPLFPLLSIAFAFVFLELGELCERLGFGHQWLNVPIYYGVLYGPFAYIYVHVKAVARGSTLLPTKAAGAAAAE